MINDAFCPLVLYGLLHLERSNIKMGSPNVVLVLDLGSQYLDDWFHVKVQRFQCSTRLQVFSPKSTYAKDCTGVYVQCTVHRVLNLNVYWPRRKHFPERLTGEVRTEFALVLTLPVLLTVFASRPLISLLHDRKSLFRQEEKVTHCYWKSEAPYSLL